MRNIGTHHRDLVLILSLGITLTPNISCAIDLEPDPWQYSPFEFEDSSGLLSTPQPDIPPTLLGEKIGYPKDQEKLEEIKQVTPQGETRTYYFPHLAGTHISEHSVLVGSGFSGNTQATSTGQGSWALGVETKHLIVPRFGPLDPTKWGLILGSHFQFVQRSEDTQVQLRAKLPAEWMLNHWFQLRMLAIADLKREARWDLQPDLPFLEAQTTYAHLTPQMYLQYQPASWLQIRIGAPLYMRTPISGAKDLRGATANRSAGFLEVGPGMYLNFPVHRHLRMKLGGAYLLRTYNEFPIITQGPLATSGQLTQTHIRALGLADARLSSDLNLALRVFYHVLSSSLGAYDFSVPGGSVALEWKPGAIWFIPKVGYWLRSYPTLKYPTDPVGGGGFTSFTTTAKQESLLSIALRTIYEVEFQNFESLYFSLTIQSQTLTNAYGGPTASSYEALANGSALDIMLGMGFFL